MKSVNNDLHKFYLVNPVILSKFFKRIFVRTGFAFVLLALLGSACSDYVNNVDPPVDQVDGDKLTDESQMRFLIAGVQQRFATTYDQTILLADALSDALYFEPNVPGATFISFEDIDFADIRLDNSSVEAQFLSLGELRFLADDLLRRARLITFEDPDLQRETYFTAYFYGGLARYFYAAYTGLSETEGGGVINNSGFIPAEDMYEQALDKLALALETAADDYQARVVSSIMARIFLFAGNSAVARAYAVDGLQEGDPPFSARYNSESGNFYWTQAGRGQTQFVVDDLMLFYLEDDPAESARILVEPVEGFDGEVYHRQARYPNIDSAIPFITWQENELILAELDYNAGAVPSARDRVTIVRASFGLDPLPSLTLEDIIDERNKTMFAQGIRLIDQRRFGEFHLEGGWEYLPIPESERLNNPNLD